MIALHKNRLRALVLPLLCAFAVLLAAQPVRAATAAVEVQTSWRLLDYIAVDYPEAVSAGRIVNAAEYQEMTEFSASVATRLAALPAHSSRAGLLAEADALKAAIAAKAAPDDIAARARRIASGLLAAYPVPLAPGRTPEGSPDV